MGFEFSNEFDVKACMKVVGIGGAGNNAVNRMISAGLNGVEFISINSDAQDLKNSKASIKIQVGCQTTKGLGTGGNPQKGKEAIEEDKEQIVEVLKGADMVFVTCGMGGGTGTGCSPVIAQIAKELGALTVGIITKPFHFEGKRRMETAEKGIAELKEYVDTLIVVPNQRLIALVEKTTGLREAFRMADDILYKATRGISDLISIHGEVNVDFADVKAVMSEMGDALMGTGVSSGENRAVEASQQAISSPLLEDISIDGAKGVLINICGNESLTLLEVNEAMSVIHEAVGPDANIIFGAVINPEYKEELSVTVIATGFGSLHSKKESEKINQDEKIKLVDFNQRCNKDDDLQKPAYLRKNKDLNDNKHDKNLEKSKIQLRCFSQEDYEIPTFMRKQMD